MAEQVSLNRIRTAAVLPFNLLGNFRCYLRRHLYPVDLLGVGRGLGLSSPEMGW